MSIENIQQMIKDAPQASTWWSEHHNQLVRFEKWQTRILGSIFLGVPIVLPGVLLVSGLGVIGGGVVIFACMLILPYVIGRGTSWLPKKYRKGFEALHVRWHLGAALPATVEQKKKTLAALLRVQNSQIQSLSEDLLTLRESPLPQAWWESLEDHLNGIANQEGAPQMVLHKTEQEQLDDVCVQVQQRCGHIAPKVLKI